MTIKKYSSELIGLPGINYEFKCCHIPFLVADDVFGALALEGSSGTGKTTIITRLGKLNETINGGRVKTYSADKVRYEDFNGCPIPNNETKVMDIYYMPNSISQMETVLIDEINRASYDNQEKFLSLLATREIDGIPSKCRYLFTAMNPLLSEDNDTYEGVQPIDKALGERMIALIKMTPFSKMPGDIRLQIIKSCFNQVNWQPDKDAAQSFQTFINNSKEVYEESKYKYSAEVASYIDSLQLDILKETKEAFKIEARRAQYIMVNILAMYALDRIFNNEAIKLENSALSALLISFPNSLWEQPINKEALKQAHQRSKFLLEQTKTAKRATITILDTAANDIENFLLRDPLPSKEQFSKLVNQSIPDETTDPINHYLFGTGAYVGLTTQKSGKSTEASAMKEQEFSRINNIHKAITNSEEHKKIRELVDYYKSNKGFPKDIKLPDFVYDSEDPEQAKSFYMEFLNVTFAQLTMATLQMHKYELSSMDELSKLLEIFVRIIQVFDSAKSKYSLNVQ